MANPVVDAIKRFIVQKFWPWFIEKPWPVIQEQVIAAVLSAFVAMRGRVETFFEQRTHRQEEATERKAEEAERQAAAASDETEAARWQGKAEAYREQLESLRSENEDLRRELDNAMREGAEDVRANIAYIRLDVSEPDRLAIGDKIVPLLGPSEEDI